MAVVGACPAKARCDGEIILPFGARSWCNVLAAASNLMLAPRGSHGAGASVFAVSGNVAQHSSLLCLRAVPRSLWSLLFLSKGKGCCAGETPLSLKRTSAVRRASCGLQSQASAVCPTRRRRASARCVLEGGAALDLAAARALLRWSWSLFSLLRSAAPTRCFSPSAHDRSAAWQLLP